MLLTKNSHTSQPFQPWVNSALEKSSNQMISPQKIVLFYYDVHLRLPGQRIKSALNRHSIFAIHTRNRIY